MYRYRVCYCLRGIRTQWLVNLLPFPRGHTNKNVGTEEFQ